jgi:two-component system sensor histidine kinase FlrB
MGRMAAEIAHQLRTPLATATLYASHLSKDKLSAEKRQQFAEQLNRQLTWLDDLVSRMMSFLRSKQGASHMLCVAELLEECRSSIEPLFESAGVRLAVSTQGGEHLVSVQRDQIRGGIVSILENALRFSKQGQEVRIRALAAHSRVDIYIEDDGPGIPEHMMARLFEPFATGSPRGTGLGLAIAKAAVEAHRGEIQARNRSEGGASFHIVLPVFEQL